jgi:hypothetical protein
VEKISYPCRESNPGPPDFQSVTESLHRNTTTTIYAHTVSTISPDGTLFKDSKDLVSTVLTSNVNGFSTAERTNADEDASTNFSRACVRNTVKHQTESIPESIDVNSRSGRGLDDVMVTSRIAWRVKINVYLQTFTSNKITVPNFYAYCVTM